MKITIKTLQQQTFSVEANESDSVKVLKQKIEDEKGKDAFPVDCQKLIYAGKILDDAKIISDYNIEEKNFVVAMITKPKAAPVAEPPAAKEEPKPTASEPEAATSATTAPPTTATSEGDASAAATTAEQTATAPDSAATTPAQAIDNASTFMSGANVEENVERLMAMGFGRNQATIALRRSFFNPDRAVEYLISGEIPEDVTLEEEPSEEPPPPAAAAPTSGTGTGGSAGGNPLEYLRGQPQFAQMCAVLRENPSLLPGLLQDLRESNPQLLAQISENQEAFIRLINAQAGSGGEGGAPAGGAPPAAGDPPPGTQYIQVSTEDKAAVDRLKALGNFNEADVLQVYLACDKDETAAANILFDQYAPTF